MALFVWPPQNVNTTGLATETKQDDIIDAVDGVETLIGATNTKLDTLNAKDFATSAKQDATNTKLDSLIAKDFATEATLQKLREWPYATWDKQALTEGATTDTWTYTSGVSTVGTITITYTDATKGTIQDVVYSPTKAV
jgi:hypothetical protein